MYSSQYLLKGAASSSRLFIYCKCNKHILDKKPTLEEQKNGCPKVFMCGEGDLKVSIELRTYFMEDPIWYMVALTHLLSIFSVLPAFIRKPFQIMKFTAFNGAKK